jgi:nucleotide-binding universal stress UspA family protein
MMYQNVLAATDGSDLATEAVKHAVGIARAFNARLTIVSVALQGPIIESFADGGAIPQSVFEEIRRGNIDHSSTILKKAAELAGPGARTEMVEFFTAYEGILDTAKKIGADVIVMGSHSRNPITRLILGSQASKVVNLSEVPVLVVK